MNYKLKLFRNLFALIVASSLTLAQLVSAAPLEQARLDALSAAMKAEVNSGQLSGIVTMVARDGEVVHTEAMGYRDAENKVAMTEDTIFRIFSMTKPIAGTALMILHDEGKFKLSDPVEKYLPELKGLQVIKEGASVDAVETEPANHAMTIRELMSHTGGLVYTPPLSRGVVAQLYTKNGIMDPKFPLKEMVSRLGKIPLSYQPGTKWEYSISVDVQGYLIEVLSGKTFDVFLQERIFEPLKMKDTGFHVAAKNAERLEKSNINRSAAVSPDGNKDFLTKPVLFSGGGGLTSTAADYMRFAQMHLNKGELDGVRIISEEAAMLMRTNQLPDAVPNIGPFYRGNQFGLDFAVVYDSEAADGLPVGTFWWWGIAGTWFWIDPVENTIFVGMIQNGNLGYARQLQAKSKQIIYGEM